MEHVIAAVDESPVARPTLDTAHALAGLLDADVTAVHVSDARPSPEMVAIVDATATPLDVRHGDTVPELVRASKDPGVCALVIGSRRLIASRRVVGSTALAVIESVDVPAVVVPPTAHLTAIHRLLVPLEGTAGTSAAIEKLVGRLAGSGTVDVVVVHVLHNDATPAFSDRSGHETRAWTDEFLRRWVPSVSPTVVAETRVGRPATEVCAAAEEVGADAVLVGWKQRLDRGRAAIVTALLELDVPVILVPTGAD
jgi:nucleotide-binding universal stress UspA family protein